jgi:hypothetical protein
LFAAIIIPNILSHSIFLFSEKWPKLWLEKDTAKMENWSDKFLDATIVFSFDHSGFKRHCRNSLEIVNISHLRGIITGASSGIGFSVAKSLFQHGMDCQLIGRNLEKLQHSFPAPTKCHSLDMSNLKQVSSFALNKVASPIDLLVHNAGSMPHSLKMTKEGFEEMFTSQVLGPFIFTKILAELGKLPKEQFIASYALTEVIENEWAKMTKRDIIEKILFKGDVIRVDDTQSTSTPSDEVGEDATLPTTKKHQTK